MAEGQCVGCEVLIKIIIIFSNEAADGCLVKYGIWIEYNNCRFSESFILVLSCIVVLLFARNIIILVDRNIICLVEKLQSILRMNQLPSKGSSSTLSIKSQGNPKIVEPLQQAILILGPEGVDRSSVFDWALKKSIAKKEVNVVSQETTAPRSLLPRVCRHFQPNISLVELVKFQQNRNFIDETIASYFQKQVFQKTRKVKFVLVINQEMLFEKAKGYAGLIKSLQGFLSMFNFKYFNEEAKNVLKKSLSIVITRSHVASKNLQLLSDILNVVQQKYFKVENKQLIVQFLGQLVNSGRIKAHQPSECEFIQKFNELKWQFFELGAYKLDTKIYANEWEAEYQYYHTQQQNLYLMSPHFKWNYKKLTESQKDSFKGYLEAKVYSFIQFYKILRALQQNLIENWQALRKEWMQQNSVRFDQYKMDKLFDTIKSFVKQNDVFNTRELVFIQQKTKYQHPNLIKAMNSVLECHKQLQKWNDRWHCQIIKRNVIDPQTKGYKQVQIEIQPSFESCMEIYSECFPQIIGNLKIFTSSHQEEILLERTICILKLSFWKYNNLYQINGQKSSDINVKFLSSCNAINQGPSALRWRLEYSERFIKSIDNNLLMNLFPNMEALQQYEQFINQHYNSRLKKDQKFTKEEMDHFDLFYNQNMCQIEMAKADYLCRLNKKEQALKCLLRGYQHITFLLNYWSEKYDDDEENVERQLDTMSTIKQNVIIKIVRLLTTLDSQSNIYRVYALQLSKHLNLIKETCILYRLLIETANGNKKIKLYREYADYCLQWGRFEEATVALQDRLSMGRDLLQDYKATLRTLKDIRSNKEKCLQFYDKNLNKLGERMPIKDKKVDQIVLGIQKHSTELISIKDQKKQQCEELCTCERCMELQVQPSLYIISEGKKCIDVDQSMYLLSQ